MEYAAVIGRAYNHLARALPFRVRPMIPPDPLSALFSEASRT